MPAVLAVWPLRCKNVGQGNVNVWQHLQSDRRSYASNKLVLNLLIQFLANVDIAVCATKIQLLSKKVCYKVSLYENFQRQSCSYIIPLSNGP